MASVRGYQFTNATKATLVEGLALAFEKGDIAILNDPVLVGELQAFESERLPSGLTRYGAPEGMHDDTVMALALAWQAVAAPRAWWTQVTPKKPEAKQEVQTQ